MSLGRGLAEQPTVSAVSPLLRALILEAVAVAGEPDPDGYTERVTALILDQVRRAQPLPGALTWPRGGPLVGLCEAVHADPGERSRDASRARSG